MVLNVVTMVSCFVMLFLFRRIDKANIKMAKLKRFTDKNFSDFKKLTEKENRKFNDSTIEMDLLLKKASALSMNISESVSDLETKLSGLNEEKSTLRHVEENLQIVSNAALDVNQQIKYIETAKNAFGDVTKKITNINQSIKKLERENSSIVNSFTDSVKMRSVELTEAMKDQLEKIKNNMIQKENLQLVQTKNKMDSLTSEFSESLGNMEQSIHDTGDIILESVKTKIDSISNSVENLETRVESSERRVYSDLNEKIHTLEDSIASFRQNLNGIRNEALSETRNEVDAISAKAEELKTSFSNFESSIFSDMKKQTDKLKSDFEGSLENYSERVEDIEEKLSSIESDIYNSRSKLIETFEIETDKIKDAMDSLSIHAISKKDEIVQAARKEAEEIQFKIEKFSDRFHEMESNVKQVENNIKTSMNKEMKNIREEFETLYTRLDDAMNEIKNYEDETKLFSRTESMMSEVEASILKFDSMLTESKSESKVLSEFIEQMEDFRDAKRSLDKELKIYTAKRENMQDINTEIHALMDMASDVKLKANELEDRKSEIERINTKIDALFQTSQTLNERISDMQDYEATITKNLEAVERIDLVMNSFDGKIQSFQKNIDKTEKQISKLKEYLQNVEETTIILKTKESEITELKDRFNEVDSLHEYLDQRVSQIQTMISKIEGMKADIDRTDSRIKNMFTQTDKKMKQFSDFMHSVDGNHSISKEIKGDVNISKNVNEGMVKTIRELSSRGWDPSDISQKLMLEENTVRLIINTATM